MTNDHLLFGRYADTSVISSLVLDGKSVSGIEQLSLNDSGQLVSLGIVESLKLCRMNSMIITTTDGRDYIYNSLCPCDDDVAYHDDFFIPCTS